MALCSTKMKSDIKDPWVVSGDEFTSINHQDETLTDASLEFEDSFVTDIAASPGNFPHPDCFSRLSDSAEYLASLESKLAKLKSRRKGKDIVQSLEEKHRSCMMEMLSNDAQSSTGDEDFMLDTPISSNHPLLRYVAPDKQALTLGELVELLKADHLSQVTETMEHEYEKEKSTSTLTYTRQ